MLLGRIDERLALDRLLAQARTGHSGVLALVGEPGIGKTALLGYAQERAEGMRVLRARGVESEAEIPFAGLLALLRPVLGALDRIPAPQADALAGALALGPASAGDRFAIGAATLSLLSASADDGPLLRSSTTHTARRVERRGAAVRGPAAGRRSDRARHRGPRGRAVAARRRRPADAARRGARPSDGGGAAGARATSPRAGRAAAPRDRRQPTGAGRAGRRGRTDRGCAAGGPVPISASIASAFLRRFGALPSRTRRVLVLAATSDGRRPRGTRAGGRAARARCRRTRRGRGGRPGRARDRRGRVPSPAGARGGLRRSVGDRAPRGPRCARRGAARPRRRPPRVAPRGGERRPRRPGRGGARAGRRPGRAIVAPTPSRRPPSSAAPGWRRRRRPRAALVASADAAWLAGDVRRALARLDDAAGRAATSGCGPDGPAAREGGDGARPGDGRLRLDRPGG